MVNPTTMVEEHTSSLQVTEPLTTHIEQQKGDLGDTAIHQANPQSRKTQKTIRSWPDCQHLHRVDELGSEKGAHNWLTALLIVAHGFAVHKDTFRGALCVRYNWTPHDLPRECMWHHLLHGTCPLMPLL